MGLLNGFLMDEADPDGDYRKNMHNGNSLLDMVGAMAYNAYGGSGQQQQVQGQGQQANLKPPADFGQITPSASTVDGGQAQSAAQSAPMTAKPAAAASPSANAQQPQFNGMIHLSDPTNGKSMTKGFKNFMDGMSKFWGGGMMGGGGGG